jgi:hypothetical protein
MEDSKNSHSKVIKSQKPVQHRSRLSLVFVAHSPKGNFSAARSANKIASIFDIVLQCQPVQHRRFAAAFEALSAGLNTREFGAELLGHLQLTNHRMAVKCIYFWYSLCIRPRLRHFVALRHNTASMQHTVGEERHAANRQHHQTRHKEAN